MARPTQEELRRRIEGLEAQMLGGLEMGGSYTDLLGIPDYAKPAYYVDVELPAGVKLPQRGVVSTQQTKLDELTDLQLALEEEKLKAFGSSFTEEDRAIKRQELYNINYQDYIKEPLSPAYGDVAAKAEGQPKVLGAPIIPTAPSMSKAGEPSLLTPFQVQSKSIDTLDWDGYSKLLQEKEGMTNKQAREVVDETRRSLDAYMSIYDQKDAEAAYEGLMAEMKAIENAPKIEKPETEGFEKTTSAFGYQVTEADMPADLTPEQMELAKQMIVQNQDKVYKGVLAAGKDVTVPHTRLTVDLGTGVAIDVPTSVYQVVMSRNPKLPNYEPFIDEKTDALIRGAVASGANERPLMKGVKNPDIMLRNYAKAEAITKAGDPNAWYLNPEAKKAVLENPEEYVQEGFFEDISPFGDVAETGGAYGFRMAMSPLNAIAGVLQTPLEVGVGTVVGGLAEVGEAAGLLPEADYFDPFELSRVRQQQRAKDTPLYEDSPILANIALNKGFTGEAEDIAKSMNLEGWQKNVVIGGGFLADIMSPDVGIIAAGAKGMSGLAGFGKAQKAMYGTSEGAIKQALKGAGNTFMNDFNFISYPLSKTKRGKALKEVPHGSVVFHLGDTTATVLRAERQIKSATNLDAVKAAVADLPPAHPYRKAAETATDLQAVKTIDPMDVAKQTEPTNARLLQEHKATINALDEVAGGKTLQQTDNVLQANVGLINNVSSSRYGKAFDKLTDTQKTDVLADTKNVIDANYARAITLNTLAPKQLAELDRIFAVTGKTWAHEEVVPNIIKAANETELGKLLGDIRTTAKVPSALPIKGGVELTGEAGQRIGGRVERMFDLTPEQANKLRDLVDRNPNITEATKAKVIADASQNKVSFSTFRDLINENIDNTAKGMSGAFGEADVSRLAPEAQERVLRAQRPLGIVGKAFKKLTGKVFKDTLQGVEETLPPPSSITMRRAQTEILDEASTMDVTLRRTFDTLLKNDDEAFRQLYRVTETAGVPLSAEEALSYAVRGPVTGRNPVDLALSVGKAADWATTRLFFTSDVRVSFMDRFTGRQQIVSNNLLNAKGQELWENEVADFMVRVKSGASRTPAPNAIAGGDVLTEMEELYKKYADITQDKDNLRFGLEPDKVVNRVRKGLDESREEMVIGLFYYAEGQRLIAKKLNELANKEIVKVTPRTIMGKDYGKLSVALGGKENVDIAFREAVATFVVEGQNGHASIDSVLFDLVEKDPRLAPVLQRAGNNLYLLQQRGDARVKNLIGLYASVARKASEAADTVNGTLKLNNAKLPTDVNTINNAIELLPNNDTLSRLLLGDKVYNDFMNAASQQRLSTLTKELDRELRGMTNAERTWNSISNAIAGVNSAFYNCLLSYNPRFHGGNTVTAPAIVYQTTGIILTPSNIAKGRRVAFAATDPTNKWSYEIAVIDKAGRPYTYGELNEILMKSGTTSQADFITKGLGRDGLKNYIKRRNKARFGVGNKAEAFLEDVIKSYGPNNLVMKEDQMFRAGAMIHALEQGRGIEDATAIAKRSLFDYNDMSAAEQAVASRYFIFYAFQRQNFMSFMEGMGNAEVMKRFLNTYKVKRGADIRAVQENDNKRFDDRFFFDDKFHSRFVLYINDREEDSVAFTSPPIPALDAPMQTFSFFYSPVKEGAGAIVGLLRPTLRNFIGLKGKFDREFYRLPPELVNGGPSALFDSEDPYAVAAFYEEMLGGTITPQQATASEGGVSGYKYPLDERQRANLKLYLELANTFTGAVSLNTNYYKLFSGEGTTYEEANLLEYTTTTPMRLTSKEEIELYNLRARRRELEKQLSFQRNQLREKRGEE